MTPTRHKGFITENFLLRTKTAQKLFHGHAARMPIYDYHCHLSPKDIAQDRRFENLTQIWLAGDHYKWRAMRSNGVAEKYITGNASDSEKFVAWARTVPYTVRNPLYHWTHLELKSPFGIIGKVLNEKTARGIYERCNDPLKGSGFSARGIITRMNVALICTTDDPVDSLEWHKIINADARFKTRVYATFRPDKAMMADTPDVFVPWVQKLAVAANVDIGSLVAFKKALVKRYDYFHTLGCRLSDHGLETVYAEEVSEKELAAIFVKALKKKKLTSLESAQFKYGMMLFFGEEQARRGWVQQLHLGAMRNNNTTMFKQLGPDTGFDSIGDASFAPRLSQYLDALNTRGALAKTILYNLNPKDTPVLTTMLGNFQDGSAWGKMQYGSAWWFLDTKEGMEAQLSMLSQHGLLSRFVGMLTDSRSFLSYPRHEYFRRILCNMIGTDVENGELPNDMALLGKIVENISYANAKEYFGL